MAYYIKQYDTKTAMRATLKAQGNPVDLTNAIEVRFIMAQVNTIIINKTINITDAVNGKVWFPFEEVETSKTGSFKGEFVVIFDDSRVETFPNTGAIQIIISDSNLALTKTITP